MIPVEEALAIVLREARPLPTETVPLEDALGRILGEDVRSDGDWPPFDRAAMDGYALRAEDAGAAPRELAVVGEVQAGCWPERGVGPGEAVRIMTGAPVPDGASAVLPVERTQRLEGGRVRILSSVARAANVARRGSEVRAGDVVLERGRLVDPAALAVLAAAGCARPRVVRRPLVAVVVTGDELVGVDERPGPAQIRNSNGPALAARARQAGATPRLLGPVPDRRPELAAAIDQGLEADVLVVSGGVSAGDYDLVEPVLTAAGVRLIFDAVAIKPGAPMVFGRRGETLVFGLPGNPVSAQVTFELFVRPCLLRMQGARAIARPRLAVSLASPVRNRSGRTNHLPALVRCRDGKLVARPVPSQGSGDLAAHARANALLVMGPERLEAAAGETLEAVLLDNFLEDDGAPL